MIIDDKVYGKQEITDPAMLDLIESAPFQRLKRIGQGGVLRELTDPRNFSRYDHSVGTMLVLRILGASREEQIAGLLHDVSHTAFSHTIDYIFGDTKKMDFQDRNHDAYVARTEIPQILERHGVSHVCARHPTKERFPLLEQDAPQLCADRVDYTLRNAVHRGISGVVEACLSDLTTCKNEIVFGSERNAKKFWRAYSWLEEHVWSPPPKLAQVLVLSRALDTVFALGQLSMDDMYKDDDHVEKKLRASDSPLVKTCLSLLDNGFSLRDDDPSPQYDLKAKLRYVDPGFVQDGTIARVSAVEPAYATHMASMRKQLLYTQGGMPVKIVPA